MKKSLQNTTAVLISFMRPEYTKVCVESLHKTYKDIKILVAENGKYNQDLREFVNERGGRYIVMPFDSGVCFARNRLVEIADTEFILVGDDDFYYTKTAKVNEMVKFMEKHPTYSLIGGRVSESKKVLNYQGHIDIHPDHFHYHPLDFSKNRKCLASGLKYQKCDITFNFFVARKKDIIDVKWDEKIKVAYEHSDWFIMLKKAGGRKVAFAEEPVVIHKPEFVQLSKKLKKDYDQFRNRKSDQNRFWAKHGVEYSIGFRGTKYHVKDVQVLKDKYFAEIRMTYDGRTYNAGDIIKTKRPNEFMRACN